jgi:hypothetical protein
MRWREFGFKITATAICLILLWLVMGAIGSFIHGYWAFAIMEWTAWGRGFYASIAAILTCMVWYKE